MDYLKSFKENCMAYLKSKTVEIPNSATKSQQKFEFEQKLKRMIQKLKIELLEQADKWGNSAYENGHSDIFKLRSDMKNTIRTLLRDWQDEQKEKSGLDD